MNGYRHRIECSRGCGAMVEIGQWCKCYLAEWAAQIVDTPEPAVTLSRPVLYDHLGRVVAP